MDKKDQIALLKINGYIDAAIGFCKNISSYQEFESDLKTSMASVLALMQIGELAKNVLSDEIKQRLNCIPWNQIYGLRNRIVHGYDDINYETVWISFRATEI